ncbi:MAG: TetR/AcrR family transcriptional regulator [Chromatiales bacterium]|jgi:AcrR family transcriptional regulator
MPYLKMSTPNNDAVNCRIMTAALDLFVERGFHNVSVHDVQKQANVSIGSIYNHFGGKQGIAKAIYHHLLKQFEEMVEEIIAEDLGYRQRCNKIIRLLFEYTETRRNIISFMLHAKHREFLPDEPPVYCSLPFRGTRSIVEKGMEAGEIRQGEPWVMAATIFGGAVRMIHLRLDGVIEEPLINHYEELIDCMWQGVLPMPVSEKE